MHQGSVRPLGRNAATIRLALIAAAAAAVVSALLLSGTPAAAGLATVDVQIVKLDDQGNPLADVVFTLGASAGVATDANGAAVFEDVSVSSADLALTEAENPADQCNDPEDAVVGSLTVDISAGGDITVEDPEPTDDLAGIVVSGKGASGIVITNTCGDDSDGSGVTNDVTLDLRVLKRDQNGDPLGDVKFGIAIADGGATGGATGADGVLELQDITVDANGDADLTLTETANPNDGCGGDVLGSVSVDVVTALELIVDDLDETDGLTAQVVGRTIVLTNDCDGVDSGEGGGGVTLPDTAAAGPIASPALAVALGACLAVAGVVRLARTPRRGTLGSRR